MNMKSITNERIVRRPDVIPQGVKPSELMEELTEFEPLNETKMEVERGIFLPPEFKATSRGCVLSSLLPFVRGYKDLLSDPLLMVQKHAMSLAIANVSLADHAASSDDTEMPEVVPPSVISEDSEGSTLESKYDIESHSSTSEFIPITREDEALDVDWEYMMLMEEIGALGNLSKDEQFLLKPVARRPMHKRLRNQKRDKKGLVDQQLKKEYQQDQGNRDALRLIKSEEKEEPEVAVYPQEADYIEEYNGTRNVLKWFATLAMAGTVLAFLPYRKIVSLSKYVSIPWWGKSCVVGGASLLGLGAVRTVKVDSVVEGFLGCLPSHVSIVVERRE